MHAKPTNTIRSMLGSPRTNQICRIRLELFTTTRSINVPFIILVKLKDRLEKGSVNTKGNPLLWVLTVKSLSTPSTEHLKILDKDPRWHQRGIKEAIYIAAKKPDLNKDLVRNPLPKAYKKLIESCDLGSTSRSISRSCDSTRQTSTSINQHQC